MNQPRQHKKASFAIINEFTSSVSRAQTPNSAGIATTTTGGGRVSPFRGRGFKPPQTASRHSSRPGSPSQFLTIEPPTPSDLSDDLMRSPTVQFNTKTYTDKMRAGVPDTSISRGILQNKEIPYIDLSNQDREMESYEIRTDVKHKTLIQIPSRSDQSLPTKPFSVLPDVHRHLTGPSPAPRRKFYNSTGDLHAKSVEPTKPPLNPRSYQKGLLRVVSSANSSPSKIPRRKSITSSLENVSSFSRRSSISPNRRLSNLGLTNKKSKELSSIIDLGIVAAGATQLSRSGSRISKPTTLSPIIGTPNKDSEQSAQEEDRSDHGLNGNGSTLMSPTRIPIRAGNSHNLLAHINSNLGTNISRANSRVNSRTSSREPSPKSMRKPPTSTNLTRTGSKQFNRTGSNRITTSNKASVGPKTNGLAVKKTTDKLRSSVKKTTSFSKEQVSKKEPASTKKEPALRPSVSNLNKPLTSVKREKSNLKREPSNLHISSLKREPSNLKCEGSTLRRDIGPSHLKRQTSKLMLATSVLSKNNSDSQLAKRLEKKNSFKNEKQRSTSESDGPESKPTATAEETRTTATNTEPKDPKLIPMTAANVVSMTTAAIAAQPVQITTAVTNSHGATLLKLNSSGQLVANSSVLHHIESTSIQSPATILEKSQKTLENIQKTVTEATDEIQRTLDENLTDLRSLENDMKKEEAKGHSKVVTMGANLEKKASTRTLVDTTNGDKSHSEIMMVNQTTKSDGTQPNVISTTTSPIEATVSVIDGNSTVIGNVKQNRLTAQNSDERISERAISVLPEVDLQSGNGTDNLGNVVAGSNVNEAGGDIIKNANSNERTSKDGR